MSIAKVILKTLQVLVLRQVNHLPVASDAPTCSLSFDRAEYQADAIAHMRYGHPLDPRPLQLHDQGKGSSNIIREIKKRIRK